MTTEISCVFRLEYNDNIVKERNIGDGVCLQEIVEQDWWAELREKDNLVAAKETLDWGHYTHRLFLSLTGECTPERIEDAKQQILRAIVLSRIVRPTPIASGGLWIESDYSEAIRHLPEIGVGFYGRAYVSQPRHELTLTETDADSMAALWTPMKTLFREKQKYTRILGALIFFDGAFHQYHAEFRHIVLHAALESLISSRRANNREQIVTRLPALVPSVTAQQANEIYDLCCDIKHSAAPLYLDQGPGIGSYQDDRDRERYEAVLTLELAVRDLFRRTLSETAFADMLSDVEALNAAYPV
jgi:hypothetical protein